MIQGLLWFITIYGTSIILIHAAHLWIHKVQKRAKSVKHYVLISNQNQLHIEWYIRSIVWFHSLKGNPLRITIMDQGSTDQTISIVEKLSRYFTIQIHTSSSLDDIAFISTPSTEAVVVQLNNQDDLRKIPMLQ